MAPNRWAAGGESLCSQLGAVCGGREVSGAGRMISGDSLTRWDRAGFQAQGLLPWTKEILKEGRCLAEGAVGKIPKKEKEDLAELLRFSACRRSSPTQHNHCFPIFAENVITLLHCSGIYALFFKNNTVPT